MKNAKVKTVKQGEGNWMVYAIRNDMAYCADIVKFIDHSPLLGKTKTYYRVDVSGKTVDSLIENFQYAKKVATNEVRKMIADSVKAPA
jgi:hypothetical protein